MLILFTLFFFIIDSFSSLSVPGLHSTVNSIFSEKFNKFIVLRRLSRLFSSKYDGAIHNGKVLNLKVLRVFASNNPKDGPVMKIKNGTQIKIGNTPNRAFILNENIVDKPVLDTVDREWYISLAEKRLEDFIPNSQYEYSLFDLL